MHIDQATKLDYLRKDTKSSLSNTPAHIRVKQHLPIL